MNRQPRTNLRIEYENLNFLYYVMENYVKEDNRENFYHDTIAKAKRKIRKHWKNYERMKFEDRNRRSFYHDDYYIDRFIFWKKEGWTKEDIEELAEDSWHVTGCDYDCSGK